MAIEEAGNDIIQDILDSRVDMQSLEEAVNGDDATQVTTRLGETYPSVKKAIKTLFENGGLPATPFATKALMTASALVDGKYAMVTDDISVVDSVVGKNNGLYVKTAGAWVKSAYDAVPPIIKDFTETTAYAASWTDGTGKVAMAIKNDGTFAADSIETSNLLIGGFTLSKVIDNKIAAIPKPPVVAPVIGGVPVGNNFPANLMHMEIYGQSLSVGALAMPIQTTVQKYDNLMFTGGLRHEHPAYDVPNFYADFIPLVEAVAFDGTSGSETPAGGATDAIKQLVASENGITYTQQKYQLLGSTSGEGGQTIDQLLALAETSLKPTITAAYNLAQSKGMTYAMPLMGWVQGESDNKPDGITKEQYKSKLQTMISLVNNHLKSLNSGLGLKGVISTQMCSFKRSSRSEPYIELAIYEAATAVNSNVYLACPLYIFDYADGFHLLGPSSKWMGAYIGLVHKRVVTDGLDWKPVHPISHVKQGKILEVKFHVPVLPLVFDTTHIKLNTNYGFQLVTSAGAAIAISSVSLTQGDTLKIIAAANIPADAKLRYAWTPNAEPNRTTGPRGNLRDSQGNDIIFDPTGINKPMHNWCPIFEYGVA